MGGNTRHFYYSLWWQVVEERLNSGTTAERSFVWGLRYLDDLILRQKSSERLYALHDYYSVTAIVNTSGTVLERYGYDGFGAPRFMNASFTTISNSAYSWETLYGAYRFDSDTGLYQVRFRYLHPKLGRWINRDPIGEAAGVNLFAYAGNNSVNRVDQLGLQAPYIDSNGNWLAPYGLPKPKNWPPTPNYPAPGDQGHNRQNSVFPRMGGGTPKGERAKIGLPGNPEKLDKAPYMAGWNGRPNKAGVPGQSFQVFPKNATCGSRGGDTCSVLVVKCDDFNAVFHFNTEDSPAKTLESYDWPSGCEAIICGGDDSSLSNCLYDDTRAAAEAAGINIVGVSGEQGCGIDGDDFFHLSDDAK